MPKIVSDPKGKKKKKSWWQRYSDASRKVPGDFLRGAEEAATGFPTGVVSIAHALDQALPASPIPGVDEGHVRDTKPIRDIGKATLKQMQEDLRHPLRNPFSTALTLSAVAPAVGAPAKVAAGTKAASKVSGKANKAKAFKTAAKRPATRKLKLADKTTDKARIVYGKPGERPKTGRYVQRGKTVEVEANPSPLARGIRKVTLDPIYKQSVKKADEDALFGKKSKGGSYARMVSRRTEDQRTRYADNLKNRKTKPVETEGAGPVENIARSPMDLMRLSMYLRPRYYLQNLGGTAQLMAHAGVSAGDVKAVIEIAKKDPELYDMMKAAGGETGTKAIAMGTGTGRLGQVSRRASELANKPEANMRTVGLWKAARDFGVETPAQLKEILRRPDSDEAQLIMARGNESLVDYGRVGGSGAIGRAEKKFVQSGLPIFYPMMKGFTRYGARFPTQHPVQSAGINYIGQEGKETQREGIGGEPQPWFPYITPLSGGRTQNLQNVYTFSPGTDIFRQAAQVAPGSERHPTLNLLQALGPSAELIHGAITGRQLATGFEYDADTLDKYGPALTALGDTAKSVIPGLEYLSPRSSAAYGDPNLEQQLMLALLGPGLYPRETNMKKVRQPKPRPKGRPKKRAKGKF